MDAVCCSSRQRKLEPVISRDTLKTKELRYLTTFPCDSPDSAIIACKETSKNQSISRLRRCIDNLNKGETDFVSRSGPSCSKLG